MKVIGVGGMRNGVGWGADEEKEMDMDVDVDRLVGWLVLIMEGGLWVGNGRWRCEKIGMRRQMVRGEGGRRRSE